MNSYLSYEDLLNKLGYHTRKSRVGSLGKALTKASKSNKSAKWLKTQLDCFYEELRKRRGERKNAN